MVLEATYGWYWAVDTLQAVDAKVHLAHPLGVKGFDYRRVKNDVRDASDLADLLRMGRLPEAWIAPPATRELRELVRHRAKLVALRSHCKAGCTACWPSAASAVPMSDLFGVGGTDLLDGLELPKAYAARITSLRRVMDLLDFEIDVFTRLARNRLARTRATPRCRPFPGSARSWPPSWSPRSATCTDSHRAQADLLGRADPHGTTSPTPPSAAAGSPNRAPAWSAGPPSNRSNACPPTPSWARSGSSRRQARPQHRRRRRRPPTTGVRLLRAARPPRPCHLRTSRTAAHRGRMSTHRPGQRDGRARS